METYFNIRYEFDIDAVHEAIAQAIATSSPAYICVADGNILAIVQRDRAYWQVVYDSLFSICDSGWVPLYLKRIHDIQRKQYCGAQIFKDIVSEGKYQMAFLGTDDITLANLKSAITPWNPRIENMPFTALPFLPVEDFDYPAIAAQLNEQKAEIIWVALGAPKQEIFMNRLRPHLKNGVMIGVGAVFNYYSGQVKRAPQWLVACKLEFAYRLLAEPQKQISRCKTILTTLPLAFRVENERKLIAHLTHQLESMNSTRIAPGKTETITAYGKSPAQLDDLLTHCAADPTTKYTLLSDDARLWQLPANVTVIPVINFLNNQHIKTL